MNQRISLTLTQSSLVYLTTFGFQQAEDSWAMRLRGHGRLPRFEDQRPQAGHWGVNVI